MTETRELDTAIQILLDRSGSMEHIRTATEQGLKSFLAEQRNTPGTCTVRLSQFDHLYEVVHSSRNLMDVPDPTLEPRGRTALLDAWGQAMTEFTEELGGRETQPDAVIFIVMTDGLENASQEWTKNMVSTMVTDKTAQGWRFIYLGANQDAIREGAAYGVPRGQTMTYQPSGQSVTSTYDVLTAAITDTRRARAAQFSEEDRRRVDNEPA